MNNDLRIILEDYESFVQSYEEADQENPHFILEDYESFVQSYTIEINEKK